MVMYNYGEICILGDFMKEKTIDSISFYIIDFMLDYYTKKYIELGKKCLDYAKKHDQKNYILFNDKNLENIDEKMFENIKRKADFIKTNLKDTINIKSDSPFYFFTMLNPSSPKFVNEKVKLRTANNVYFDRNTPNWLILKEGKERLKKETIQEYLRQFFIGYYQDNGKDLPIKPLGNYIGIINLMEILIRSIFFFEMNPYLIKKERETLLNIFTWMVISNYKNLFTNKNGYWKIGYYFRALLKQMFFNESNIIQSYDDNSNLKDIIKEMYKNTTKKLESILSKNIIEALPFTIFANNISNKRLSSLNNKLYLTAIPFFITIGRDIDNRLNNPLSLYIAITSCNATQNDCFFKNIILSYASLT